MDSAQASHRCVPTHIGHQQAFLSSRRLRQSPQVEGCSARHPLLANPETHPALCEAKQQPASCAYTALLADLAFLSIACGWLIQAR
jgi:hypothetical protein